MRILTTPWEDEQFQCVTESVATVNSNTAVHTVQEAVHVAVP